MLICVYWKISQTDVTQTTNDELTKQCLNKILKQCFKLIWHTHIALGVSENSIGV